MQRSGERETALEKIITDLTRQDVINYVLRTVDKLEGFWKYLYRNLVSEGFQVRTQVTTDIDYKEGEKDGEEEGYYVITWRLDVMIPESLIAFIASLRKRKVIKIKKPHPVIRQRYRFQEEVGEQYVKEAEKQARQALSSEENYKEVERKLGEKNGKGIQDNSSG